jgi:Fe-Mn family superoxide dismutase
MDFTLPPLPYAQAALEPVISERTVFHHHQKHHAGYLEKLDAALGGPARERSLPCIVREAHASEDVETFNLAAQVWNHSFYWQSMTPDGGRLDDDDLQRLIEMSFGSTEAFETQFAEAALNEFGSGWAWLLYDPAHDALLATSTTDAVNPLSTGCKPLLTLDVWEHAYYLDHQHQRDAYVEGFLERLINWPFAAENLAEARSTGQIRAEEE